MNKDKYVFAWLISFLNEDKFYLVNEARQKRVIDIFKLGGNVYAFDSTIFDCAYNNFKMLYRIHQIGAYFVVRTKKNLQYKSIKWKRRLPKMYSL